MPLETVGHTWPHLLRRGLLLLALAATPATSRADLLLDYSGNTHPQHNDSIHGAPRELTNAFVDFAVFDESGGSAGDAYHTGFANFNSLLAAAGLNTVHGYLYLFEVSNKSPQETITSLNLATVGALEVAAFGVLNNNVSLRDAEGLVSFHNAFGPSPAAPGDVSGAVTYPTGGVPWIAGNGDVVGHFSVFMIGDTLSTSGLLLDHKATSALIAYVSDAAPNGWDTVGVSSAGTAGATADGLVPTSQQLGVEAVSVPEPGSLALTLMGCTAFGAMSLRKRPRRANV